MTRQQFITDTKNNYRDFVRIENDVNGNPRYVMHFGRFLTESEKYGNLSVSEKYEIALKRSRKIGGRQYRGKWYGGGIVFQSYNVDEKIGKIYDLVKEAKKAESAQ